MPHLPPPGLTRLVVDPKRLHGDRLALLPGEAHYLRRVRRLRAGDPVEVRDGHGIRCLGTLADATSLHLGPRESLPRPSGVRVHLAFAPAKGPRADALLEKATELGAAGLHPVITARSVQKDAGDRFARIVRAAARQCGAAFEPDVSPARPLRALLASPPAVDLALVATPDAVAPLRDVLPEDPPASALVLTGPEGGLTPAEVASAVAAGFRAFRLGDLVLRAETAPLAALIVLRHRFGDLG